jgi:catechol 2,3-dioxygenase-like lactoylglutathione lyase family enzyme
MIAYTTLGTNDLDRAMAYYDDLLAVMGARRFDTRERYAFWGKRRGLGMLALMKPNDGKAATVGNGVMVTLAVRSRGLVHQVHERALALGSVDEGAPGVRNAGFYGAYFRDLDGNKLCVVTYEQGGPAAD